MRDRSRRPSKPSGPLESGAEDADYQPGDDAIIGVALRWSVGIALGVAAMAALVIWILWPQPDSPDVVEVVSAPPSARPIEDQPPPIATFTDVTESAGIFFQHENGAAGEKLLPETMGAGCAFFDFDNDGDQDLLFVNSSRWPWDERPADSAAPTMTLYRNDGRGVFEDATADAGVDVSFYGMGAAVGDYDNDGDVDLFLTAVGPNHLFRNEGGRFVEVTTEAGVAGADDAWGTSAAWFDYNHDGRLDLFVCNYVRWTRQIDKDQDFQLVGVGRAYGPPTSFEGAFPYLYRNDGAGRFTDVSEAAGVRVRNRVTGVPLAKSLGVAPVDLDADGWMDLVVANDTVQNLVFHNQRDGSFTEIGELTGIAFDAEGRARGAMGIDTARFRDDQTLGVAIGNFANEMTALYVADEPLQFVDAAIATGLGPQTRLELTFGLFFFDYDLDGRMDLLCANGHLEQEIHRVMASQHYAQPPRLFWNQGPGARTEFTPVGEAHCGPDLMRPMVGRGAAFADMDADGDLDVVLTEVGGRPRLLRNDQQLNHHWIRLRLVGASANRDAIGAWIEVTRGERVTRRQVMPTRGYLSQSELPVTIGLGADDAVDSVEVIWPDGARQRVTDVVIDAVTEVTQAADAGRARD